MKLRLVEVFASTASDRLSVAKLVHTTLGASLAAVSAAVRDGKPVATFRLTGNDHDEQSAKLRGLCGSAAAAHVGLRFVVTDHGQAREEATREHVLNMLSRWEQIGEQLDRDDAYRHDAEDDDGIVTVDVCGDDAE